MIWSVTFCSGPALAAECGSDCVSTACTLATCTPSGCVVTPKVCNDGLPCTVDGCDDATGCTHESLCDDGDPCSGATCGPTGCTWQQPCGSAPGTGDPGAPTECVVVDGQPKCVLPTDPPPVCDDGDVQTTDFWYAGQCVAVPSCDDGHPCTAPELPNVDLGCASVWIPGCESPEPVPLKDGLCQLSAECESSGRCGFGPYDTGLFGISWGCTQTSCVTAEDCAPSVSHRLRICAANTCRYPEVSCGTGPCVVPASGSTPCTFVADGKGCGDSGQCFHGKCFPLPGTEPEPLAWATGVPGISVPEDGAVRVSNLMVALHRVKPGYCNGTEVVSVISGAEEWTYNAGSTDCSSTHYGLRFITPPGMGPWLHQSSSGGGVDFYETSWLSHPLFGGNVSLTQSYNYQGPYVGLVYAGGLVFAVTTQGVNGGSVWTHGWTAGGLGFAGGVSLSHDPGCDVLDGSLLNPSEMVRIHPEGVLVQSMRRGANCVPTVVFAGPSLSVEVPLDYEVLGAPAPFTSDLGVPIAGGVRIPFPGSGSQWVEVSFDGTIQVVGEAP